MAKQKHLKQTSDPKEALSLLRSEVINIASKFNQIAYTLDNESAPFIAQDLEQVLRQANLPYAVEEWLRCENLKAFGHKQTHSIFED